MVSLDNILQDAYKRSYIVPAFNFDNYDVLDAILTGANKAKSPVIVQITQIALEALGIEQVVSFVKNRIKNLNIPITLHLDHADNIDIIDDCIRAGFNSVMIDCSEKSLDDNIRITKQVIEKCANFNVSVEAEVGKVGNIIENRKEDNDYTTIDNIIRFCEQCKVSAVGISIGNIHGMRNKNVLLDQVILERLSKVIHYPIVLHGCSGVVETEFKMAINYGVCKINIETELRVAFRKALEEILINQPDEVKPRNIMKHVRTKLEMIVIHKSKVIGSFEKSL